MAHPEDELLTLLDSLALCAEPMFAMNERHRIVFWNKPLVRLLGWSYDDVAGKSCATVFAGDDEFGNRYCCEACPVMSMAHRGDSIRQFRLSVKGKDGASHRFEVAALRFVFPSSRRMILVHTVRPVAEVAAPQALAAHGDATAHADARVRELTKRELEIVNMLAAGQTAREIAVHLGISPLTARNHIQRVFEKLEVHSRAEAVAFAWRMKLVQASA